MVTKGLSERRALAVLCMSASAYRYLPASDRNVELREQILALAQRYKRYGVGMIYQKPRRRGMLVNYKRVERLYQEAKLQVRRPKRKKVPVGDRQPLLRPRRANEVWSMDFVFDRTADGRVLKAQVIVDDGTHELVAVDVERAISGHGPGSWIVWRSSAACRRSSEPTTARSSAARRCSNGHMPGVWPCA